FFFLSVTHPVNCTLVVLGQFAWQMCRWPLAMPLGVCQGCGLTLLYTVTEAPGRDASDHLGSGAISSSSSSCSSSGVRRKGSRDCSVCFESEVIAALVPCGHNLFCMECANRICEKTEPQCPVCHSAVTQAIRIFS
uniref:RING-type domain-containing protein n=1 Tax=Serinus canaria TaxID=9135 RepID=A0A8C9MRT2_SERCA